MTHAQSPMTVNTSSSMRAGIYPTLTRGHGRARHGMVRAEHPVGIHALPHRPQALERVSGEELRGVDVLLDEALVPPLGAVRPARLVDPGELRRHRALHLLVGRYADSEAEDRAVEGRKRPVVRLGTPRGAAQVAELNREQR